MIGCDFITSLRRQAYKGGTSSTKYLIGPEHQGKLKALRSGYQNLGLNWGAR